MFKGSTWNIVCKNKLWFLGLGDVHGWEVQSCRQIQLDAQRVLPADIMDLIVDGFLLGILTDAELELLLD